MIRRLLKSFCVWYVYFPHLTMLRLMGPLPALALTRVFALCHWLMTFAGAHKRARRAIAAALPELGPGTNLSTTLRRYLEVKHQRFVEWYLYPTARGRRFVERTYRDLQGREHFDTALADGKGVIVLVYHFGMAKMAWPALKVHGYDNYHHVFRGTTYAGETVGAVANAAMRALAETEEKSGLGVIYHRPFFTFAAMVRHLRSNHIVGMNGDGMMGTEFAELPFLGGTMTFPTGPARLAAQTGAPLVPVYAMHEGLARHRIVVHEPIYCRENTLKAATAATAETVALLQQYVRKFPWAWWTWRRLDVEKSGEGPAKYTARALATEEGTYHAPVVGVQGR